jgi:hypothetical protein
MPRGALDAIALGPPSVLSTWAFDLLREVCALIPNRAAIRAIDREDPLEPDGDRVPLIYLSHFRARRSWRDAAKESLPFFCVSMIRSTASATCSVARTSAWSKALRLQTASAARQSALGLARIELGISRAL